MNKRHKQAIEPYRQPRPLGTTSLMQQINNASSPEQSKQARRKLNKHVIMSYLTNGHQLNGKMLSLDEVSYYLNIPKIEVIKEMGRITRNHLGINMQDGRAFLESITGILVGSIFLTQKSVQNQAEILIKSQGNQHKPFVTRDLNDALANQIKAQGPLLDLLKIFTGNRPQVAIQFNSDTQPNQGNAEAEGGLTTSEAFKIIEDRQQNPLILNPNQMKALEGSLGLETLPEVRATHQTLEVSESRTRGRKAHSNPRVADEGIDLDTIIIIPPK